MTGAAILKRQKTSSASSVVVLTQKTYPCAPIRLSSDRTTDRAEMADYSKRVADMDAAIHAALLWRLPHVPNEVAKNRGIREARGKHGKKDGGEA